MMNSVLDVRRVNLVKAANLKPPAELYRNPFRDQRIVKQSVHVDRVKQMYFLRGKSFWHKGV